MAACYQTKLYLSKLTFLYQPKLFSVCKNTVPHPYLGHVENIPGVQSAYEQLVTVLSRPITLVGIKWESRRWHTVKQHSLLPCLSCQMTDMTAQ